MMDQDLKKQKFDLLLLQDYINSQHILCAPRVICRKNYIIEENIFDYNEHGYDDNNDEDDDFDWDSDSDEHD